MERGTLTAPNQASVNRLTGKGIFFPTGSINGTHLGLIYMIKEDYGVVREKVMAPIEGVVNLLIEETISVSPTWTLDGKQFHTPVNPLLLMGTRNADVVQTSATASTVTVTAKLGATIDLGFRKLSNVSVAVASVGKTADVDYIMEAGDGLISFPVVAAGIADNASVVVTYDRAAVTRESYTAFNNPNLQGTLKVFEKDSRDPLAVIEWTFVGNLTMDKLGDSDPTKHRQWSIRFSVVGQPTVLRRTS